MCKADTYAIITDRPTADSASRSIQFREHGSMALKGKSGKIPTFEVMHWKSNNMQLVNASEQNFLTTDGKFDNLASFLPASILDVIIGHCKDQKSRRTMTQESFDISGNDDSGSHLFGSLDLSSTFLKFPMHNSVMRQAVCITLKYNSNDNRRERRRSIRHNSINAAQLQSRKFEEWVDEVRAGALDHGGDLVSITSNKIAVLLFFTGALTVRHHDTSRGVTKKKTTTHHSSSDAGTGGHENELEKLMEQHSSNASKDTKTETAFDLSDVTMNAIGYLTRKSEKTFCGFGVGNVMTVMSSSPASGAFTHFGECIDIAHASLAHCEEKKCSAVCPADVLPILNGTNLLKQDSAKPISSQWVSFELMDSGDAKYINPGLTVSLPFVRRFLTPKQLEIAVSSIQSYVYSPLVSLSMTGESLLRLSTASQPLTGSCAVIRSRLCSEANSNFFGKDSNAFTVVQKAIDDVTSDLPAGDSYVTSCSVSGGEMLMTCVIERDVATAAYQMLQISHKLSRRHPDTAIFISYGGVSFSTENGAFYVRGSCIDRCQEMLKKKEFPREPIVCDIHCATGSSMPWLVGFSPLNGVMELGEWVLSPKTKKSRELILGKEQGEPTIDDELKAAQELAMRNFTKLSSESAADPKPSAMPDSALLFAPFEKIPVVAERVYSKQKSALGHLEGRKELIEALKTFAITQDMSTVLVEGDRGMGKTNLVTELRKVAENLGIRAIHTVNLRAHRTAAFHTWRKIVQTLLNPENKKVRDIRKKWDDENIQTSSQGIMGGQLSSIVEAKEDELETAESIIKENLPPDFPLDKMFLLNDLLPFELKVGGDDAQRDINRRGEGGKNTRLDLYASIIAHHCEGSQPLVLIMEDWEFADSLSWKLLFVVQHLCSRNLLFVLTASSGASKTRQGHDLRYLKCNPDLVLVELHPLNTSAVKSIIVALAGTDNISPSVIRAVYKASHGIPSLVYQIVQHFVDLNLMGGAGGTKKDEVETILWEMKEFIDTKSQMATIASLRAVTLKPLEVALLCVANIFESSPFSSQDIMDYIIHEVIMPDDTKVILEKDDPKNVGECLSGLEAKGFLNSLREEHVNYGTDGKLVRHVRVRFFMKSGIVADIISRNNMTAVAALHVKFAAHLQLKFRNDIHAYYTEIANHYRAGFKNGKALKFLMMAADDAVDMYAPHEALKLYGTYLKIAGKKKAAQLRKEETDEKRKRGKAGGVLTVGAVVLAEDGLASNEIVSAGSSSAGSSSDDTLANSTGTSLSGAEDKYGRFAISDVRKSHEYGHIHRMMGEAYYYIGDFDKSQSHLEAALEFFGAAPGSSYFRGTVRHSEWRMKLYILAKVTKFKLTGGLTKLSLLHSSELPPAERILASERCLAWFKLTQIHYVKGDIVSYAYAAMQNLANSEFLGKSSELCNAITQFIPICSSVGYNQLAERFCRESMQMSESVDDQEAGAHSLIGRAVYLAGSGQLIAATDMVTIACQIFEASGNIQAWWESLAMICANNFALGMYEEGLKVAEQGIEASMKVDNYTMINWFLQAKISSLISLGRTREAYEVMGDGSIAFGGGEWSLDDDTDGEPEVADKAGRDEQRRSSGGGGKKKGKRKSKAGKKTGVSEDELFLPELARSYAMEGKFDKAVEHALKYYNGPTTSWWHYNCFSCCAEVFTLSYLSSRMSGATISNRGHKDLLRLAKESIEKLRIMGKNFQAIKPEYFLAQGRYLCAKGKTNAGKRILAQAVYLSDNFTLLPVKARTCLEIAKSCNSESLVVRQFYAKNAHDTFKGMGMTRMAMQANLVSIRLKPSSMQATYGQPAGNDIIDDENWKRMQYTMPGGGEGRNGLNVKTEGLQLVGRDAELSLLSKKANMLRTDEGVGTVLIEGEAERRQLTSLAA